MQTTCRPHPPSGPRRATPALPSPEPGRTWVQPGCPEPSPTLAESWSPGWCLIPRAREGQARKRRGWARVTDKGDRRAVSLKAGEGPAKRMTAPRVAANQGPQPHSCRALSDTGRRKGSLACAAGTVQLSPQLGCLLVPSHSTFACPALCVSLCLPVSLPSPFLPLPAVC